MLKLTLMLTPMQVLCANKALQSPGLAILTEHFNRNFPIDHADTEFLWKTPQTASVIPSYMMTTY